MSDMRDDTLQRVQAWLKEHADCAGHEFDLCALVDKAILDADNPAIGSKTAQMPRHGCAWCDVEFPVSGPVTLCRYHYNELDRPSRERDQSVKGSAAITGTNAWDALNASADKASADRCTQCRLNPAPLPALPHQFQCWYSAGHAGPHEAECGQWGPPEPDHVAYVVEHAGRYDVMTIGELLATCWHRNIADTIANAINDMQEKR